MTDGCTATNMTGKILMYIMFAGCVERRDGHGNNVAGFLGCYHDRHSSDSSSDSRPLEAGSTLSARSQI